MALRGSFQVFPLELILGLLAEARATGQLRLGTGTIEITDGAPTAAKSRALSGGNAVAAIVIAGPRRFEFVPGATGDSDLSLGMDELRERVRDDREALPAIRLLVPDDHSTFTLTPRAASGDSFAVTPTQLHLMRAVEGRKRDVARLANAVELDRMTTLRGISELVREGLVTVTPPAPPKPRAAKPDTVAPADERLIALNAPPTEPSPTPLPAPVDDARPKMIGDNEIAARADRTSIFVSHYMPAGLTILGLHTPDGAPSAAAKQRSLFGLFEIFKPKPKAAEKIEDAPSSPRHLAALANALLFGFFGGDEELREREARALIAQAPVLSPALEVVDGKIRSDAIAAPAERAVPHLHSIINQLYGRAQQVQGGDHAQRVLRAAVDQVWGSSTELRRDAERIVGLGTTLRARLVIEKGGSNGPFELGEAPYNVGRSTTNEIVLHDPSVSRTHARLSPRAGRFVLADAGSAAGTRVNGQRLGGERTLKHGDKIALGDVLLRFEQE